MLERARLFACHALRESRGANPTHNPTPNPNTHLLAHRALREGSDGRGRAVDAVRGEVGVLDARVHGAVQLHVHVVAGDRRLRVDGKRRLLERAPIRNALEERYRKVQPGRGPVAQRGPSLSGMPVVCWNGSGAQAVELAEALDHPLLGLRHHQEDRVKVAMVTANDDGAARDCDRADSAQSDIG